MKNSNVLSYLLVGGTVIAGGLIVYHFIPKKTTTTPPVTGQGGNPATGSAADIVPNLQFDPSWGNGSFRAITRGELDTILTTMASHYNNGYWRSTKDTTFTHTYTTLSGQTFYLKVNDNGGLFKETGSSSGSGESFGQYTSQFVQEAMTIGSFFGL